MVILIELPFFSFCVKMNAELWLRGFLLFLMMIGKQADKSGFKECCFNSCNDTENYMKLLKGAMWILSDGEKNFMSPQVFSRRAALASGIKRSDKTPWMQQN